MQASILSRPLQPSVLRQCPCCGRLLALRLLREYEHAKVGEVKVYRCKSCGRESEYVANHPPKVV